MEAWKKMPAASPMPKKVAWRLFYAKKFTKNEHQKAIKTITLSSPFQNDGPQNQLHFSSLSYSTAESTSSTQGSVRHSQPLLRLSTHWWPPAHKHPGWLYDSIKVIGKNEATATHTQLCSSYRPLNVDGEAISGETSWEGDCCSKWDLSFTLSPT